MNFLKQSIQDYLKWLCHHTVDNKDFKDVYLLITSIIAGLIALLILFVSLDNYGNGLLLSLFLSAKSSLITVFTIVSLTVIVAATLFIPFVLLKILKQFSTPKKEDKFLK